MSLILFAKKGFEKVTVEEICSNLGLSKGTLYVHFRSKHQVALELFLTGDDYYNNVLLKKLPRCSSSAERLEFCMTHATKYINKVGKMLIRVTFQSQLGPSKAMQFVTSEKRPLYRICESIIREGQESGEFRNDISSRDIAFLAIRAFRSVMFDWCLVSSKLDLEHETNQLFKLIIRGLMTRSG